MSSTGNPTSSAKDLTSSNMVESSSVQKLSRTAVSFFASASILFLPTETIQSVLMKGDDGDNLEFFVSLMIFISGCCTLIFFEA
uniref:Uncharacterized protein n=1 Tax=Romanomermis culicivorax TaxID=13658 RepID=A0A915J476_ROMCU